MRQYIGARYVPTFADPLTWDNSHSYEALMMVDYMGDTYTSKKPVPPGVAISDTEYWVMTGSFNSQLSAIRSDVEDLQKHVYRKYVFVSDSYGASVVPAIVSMLGLSASDYVSIQQGGSCFGATYGTSDNWQSMIENTTTADDDTYTDVVYIGGCNEASIAEATITTNARNCFNYVAARFTNAKQWYFWAGYFGGLDSDTYNLSYRLRLNRRLPKCIIDTDCPFIINEVWYPMADSDNQNSSDWVHPTSTGAKYIAGEICSCLFGGSADYKTDCIDAVTLTTSHTVDWFYMTAWRHNEKAYGSIRAFHLSLAANVQMLSGGSTVTLGTISNRIIRGGENDGTSTYDLYLGTGLFTCGIVGGGTRLLVGELFLSKDNELKVTLTPAWSEAPGYEIHSIQLAYFHFEVTGFMN